MSAATFELVEIEAEAAPIVELRGEVDATNATRFDEAIADHTAVGRLILDLSFAAYIDSAGFEVLDRALGTGVLTVVVSRGSVVRRVAELMSVPFCDTIDQALHLN